MWDVKRLCVVRQTDETLDKYNALYFFSISAILLFGGIIAPALEVKLGLGGQSYSDLIRFLHLPQQLSQVDPFVASFTGGAVGVISSLMLIETNNVKQQSQKRCGYCNVRTADQNCLRLLRAVLYHY